MMFYLSKILWGFFQPSSLLVILFAVGAVFAILGKARPALKLFASGGTLYLIFVLSPLAGWLLAPLELEAVTGAARNLDGATGIIVLGGAVESAPSLANGGAPHLNEAADRMVEALRLAARYPSLPVLFSGGNGALLPGNDSDTEAAAAQRFFEAFNLVPPRLKLENRSRNTFENAVQSAKMLQPKPGQKWILVTSAFHMPRAKALFEAQGFDILPRPVDFRTNGPDPLRRVDLAAKEWCGLLAAWLAGELSRRQIFPGAAGA